MKATVIHEFGDVDALKYEDIETPKPKPSHVLIKVREFSVFIVTGGGLSCDKGLRYSECLG